MRNQQREKLLFRYSSALSRGDFAVIAAIYAAAERDPVLARQLAELDAVYAAEPLPTFSQNGHRRENHVSIYVESAPKPRRFSLNYALVYAAALLVVGLLGAVLFANRPDDDVNAALPAAQSSATPTFTSTPLPATAALLELLLPMPGSAALPLICAGHTPDVILEARSLPDLGAGVVVGYLPENTPVSVVDSAQATTEGWYYVIADIDGRGRVQGWLQANAVIPDGDCPYAYSEDSGTVRLTYVVQAGDTLISIAAAYGLSVEGLGRLLELNGLSATSVIEPGQSLIIEVPATRPQELRPTVAPFTPEPTSVPLDPMLMTATAVIQQATGTAEGLLSGDAAPLDGLHMTATQIIRDVTAAVEAIRGITITATPISP